MNTSEISFPEEEDLVNYTHHQVRPARIVIPGQLLQENSSWIGFNGNKHCSRCYIHMVYKHGERDDYVS